MRILGISGLANATNFKRVHWPGLDEREYRISQGHDAAAALVVDGVLVAAAAEERFNLKKHTGDFPVSATRYCLSEAGISLADVEEIVHALDSRWRFSLPARKTLSPSTQIMCAAPAENSAASFFVVNNRGTPSSISVRRSAGYAGSIGT